MTDTQRSNLITWIPVRELYSHPDNPRKDLGDLKELADSIKAKGIMQNLTVVARDSGGIYSYYRTQTYSSCEAGRTDRVTVRYNRYDSCRTGTDYAA